MDLCGFLIGIAAGSITSILGGIGFELVKKWADKKGKVDIYYLSCCNDTESCAKIRLQIYNLTRSDYIMRDIQLVEMNTSGNIIYTYRQKQEKISDNYNIVKVTPSKVYGEDCPFSFVINLRNMSDFLLQYEKKDKSQKGKYETDSGGRIEIGNKNREFETVPENIALQYHNEKGKVITIPIKPNQLTWEKAIRKEGNA